MTDESLDALFDRLEGRVAALAPGEVVRVTVLDPDVHPDRFAGERVAHNGVAYRHRDHACWLALAEELGCAYMTPRLLGEGLLDIGFRKLDPKAGWHDKAAPSGSTERYGAGTDYARIDKFEQPDFLASWRRALAFLKLSAAPRVLCLGCHQGDELAHLPGQGARVGVDHSESAIAAARERYPSFAFHCADINALPSLDLGPPFNLVVAINTLQSAHVDTGPVLRHIVADRLAHGGALLLGLPNSRYIGTTLRYGTAAKHRRGPELTPLLKDATFFRRYLNQHRFDVSVTGKNTVLIAGRRP